MNAGAVANNEEDEDEACPVTDAAVVVVVVVVVDRCIVVTHHRSAPASSSPTHTNVRNGMSPIVADTAVAAAAAIFDVDIAFLFTASLLAKKRPASSRQCSASLPQPRDNIVDGAHSCRPAPLQPGKERNGKERKERNGKEGTERKGRVRKGRDRKCKER
jgi:hypothetical protein